VAQAAVSMAATAQ